MKLSKNAVSHVLENSRCTPSLIELQTFISDSVRIVNNRTLTTISDQPNHLSPITPISFLGQQLSPNTPWCELHDQRDLRKDYLFYATLPHLVLVGVDKILSAYFTGQNKWRELKKNLVPGQLVLVMDSADLLSK